MHLILVALALLTTAPGVRVYDRGQVVVSRRSDRGQINTGTSVAVDAGVLDLNGFAIPLARQCTGADVYTELPRQKINFARASSAYCTKSDGTLVLVATDVPRRERMGLLVEAAGANDVTAPRDLTDASWTRSNTTAAKTATGADGVANSASTLTSTSTNGTAVTTVTVGSSLRSTSMRIKRRTGTSAVTVTRDNFSHGTDISASLSATTWKWVRDLCGGHGDDLNFSMLDNCVEIPALTATAANPTIGIKLAANGDAVDVDFVQDEASPHATSPMVGFSRAAEKTPITLDGSLPTTQGEMLFDYVLEWTPNATFDNELIDTRNFSGAAGIASQLNGGTGALQAQLKKTGTTVSQLSIANAAPLKAGNAKSMRFTWGDGSWRVWLDGQVPSDGFIYDTASMPDTHTVYTVGEVINIVQFDGWVSRVRWMSGAFESFKGSRAVVDIHGDSIVASSPSIEGFIPAQIVSTALGGRALEKYVLNEGVSGIDIYTCRDNWIGDLNRAIDAGSTSKLTLLVQCGINSNNIDAGAVRDAYATMVDLALDAGAHVVPCTMIPNVANAGFVAMGNSLITTAMTARGVTTCDTFTPMESPPGSGDCGANCSDGTHPTSAGSIIMSNKMATCVQAVSPRVGATWRERIRPHWTVRTTPHRHLRVAR